MNFNLPPGGILVGLGADLIEIARVRGVFERQGDRFLQRVFTDEERAYCFSNAHPHKHLAARFAAKEAVSKCFTTGIGAELGWKSVSVYHGERKEPLVRLDEKGTELLRRVGATHVLLTLSHTETMAMAVAALVKNGDEEDSSTLPEKPSRIPSWVMLGFVLGALFVLALPRRAAKPVIEEPAAPVLQSAPAAPPRVSTIEAVFAAWGKYAVWDNDLTQVALWNGETKSFSDCFEVLRLGDALYFRSIPRLTHPVLTHGVTGDSPLQYTETEAQRQVWLGARMDENWRSLTRPPAPAAPVLAPSKG